MANSPIKRFMTVALMFAAAVVVFVAGSQVIGDSEASQHAAAGSR